MDDTIFHEFCIDELINIKGDGLIEKI